MIIELVIKQGDDGVVSVTFAPKPQVCTTGEAELAEFLMNAMAEALAKRTDGNFVKPFKARKFDAPNG